MNFGKTANQACCACGGGSALDVPPDASDDPPPLSDNDCFDFPIDWNDSVGGKFFRILMSCEYMVRYILTILVFLRWLHVVCSG